jgi:hypothetical protein
MRITIDVPDQVAEALTGETGIADVALFARRAVRDAAAARLLAARKATVQVPDLRDVPAVRAALEALTTDLDAAYPDPGTAVSATTGGEP